MDVPRPRGTERAEAVRLRRCARRAKTALHKEHTRRSAGRQVGPAGERGVRSPERPLVYVTDRARDAEDLGKEQVFVGGVNDVAVFAIDQKTGEPSLLEHVDRGGIFPRTFGIDASSGLLVIGNQEPGRVGGDGRTRRIVPDLAIYRIGEDGHLTELNRHQHRDNGDVCF